MKLSKKISLATATSAPPIEFQPFVPLADSGPPPFPTDALPPWAADWVRSSATALQVPEDTTGTFLLGACGVALAGKTQVALLRDDSFTEPLNLQVCLIDVSGGGKSPAHKRGLAPVRAYEREAIERAAPERRIREERQVVEQKLKHARNEAAKDDDDGANLTLKANVGRLAADLDELVVPPKPRMMVDDSSPERVATMLCDLSVGDLLGIARLAWVSAEGAEVFDLLLGRYNKGAPNMDFALKAWSGEQFYVDRKGDEPRSCQCPLLSMLLAIQPSVIRSVAKKKGDAKGRGLLGRM